MTWKHMTASQDGNSRMFRYSRIHSRGGVIEMGGCKLSLQPTHVSPQFSRACAGRPVAPPKEMQSN